MIPFKEDQTERRIARNHCKQREEEIKYMQEHLKGLQEQMYIEEEKFFSHQVGRFFKSKGNRFFHILKFEGKDNPYKTPLFRIDFFDLNRGNFSQDATTTCYNVFGHEFELTEITLEEFKEQMEEKEQVKGLAVLE